MHTPKIKQLKVKHVCQKQLGKLISSYQMYETRQKNRSRSELSFLLFSENSNKQNKLVNNN